MYQPGSYCHSFIGIHMIDRLSSIHPLLYSLLKGHKIWLLWLPRKCLKRDNKEYLCEIISLFVKHKSSYLWVYLLTARTQILDGREERKLNERCLWNTMHPGLGVIRGHKVTIAIWATSKSSLKVFSISNEYTYQNMITVSCTHQKLQTRLKVF